MNRVVSYCQRGARLRGICCSLRGKSRLTSCTLLTRWSASVLKVGVRVAKLTKQDWPIVLH